MKIKSFFYLMLPVTMLIASCGGGEEKTEGGKEAESDEIDLEGMAEEDTLKAHGLDAVVWVPEELAPDGSQIPSQVEPDEDNMIWKVKSGKRFHVVIRVVDGEGNYIKRKKDELAGGIFKVEYLDEKENYILYKATLPEKASKIEFYKFYGVKKVNGEEYEFYTEEATEHRKVDVENVKKSFLAFGEKIVEE